MRTTLSAGPHRAGMRPRCPTRTSAVKVCANLCPYSTLGVASGASDGEIKQAYRKLVLQYHPDINHASGAERRFMSIQQAYELLTNKSRHPESHNGKRPDWAFHDWYWSFAEQRRWNRRSSGAGKEPFARQQEPEAAVHKQPEHQATLRSQLAGLRHRAAIRSTKKQQQAAAAGDEVPVRPESSAASEGDAANVEYAADMSDGCNVGFAGVSDWAAAEQQQSGRRRFTATESHKQQVMHQMAGLHRRAAAAHDAGGVWQ